ncbi:MAG: 50S ribosomal protein L17 [Candidatus Melainabacteria bacterium]|nr:50S ribosomal protein L17 [Candidatus Melainabacteria bacterium]
MRHRCRVHKLSRPADQRKALIRTLLTSLFTYDEILTTMGRAKAMKAEADRIVTWAKQGDLHAMRQVLRHIYNQKTGHLIEDNEREIPETVLRRIFRTVGPRYTTRTGGYTRIIPAPPRRGDAAPMALVQLVEAL